MRERERERERRGEERRGKERREEERRGEKKRGERGEERRERKRKILFYYIYYTIVQFIYYIPTIDFYLEFLNIIINHIIQYVAISYYKEKLRDSKLIKSATKEN